MSQAWSEHSGPSSSARQKDLVPSGGLCSVSWVEGLSCGWVADKLGGLHNDSLVEELPCGLEGMFQACCAAKPTDTQTDFGEGGKALLQALSHKPGNGHVALTDNKTD